MERHAGILGQWGPIAKEGDKEGVESSQSFASLQATGGLAPSDSEKSKALSEILEAQ